MEKFPTKESLFPTKEPLKPEEFPTRESLKPLVEKLTGNKPGAKDRILEEISNRVTKGMNEADAMRFELYVMDIIRAVENGKDKPAEELLAVVKGGDAYNNLNTVMNVPDSTTLTFIAEVKEKLTLPK